MCVRNQHDPSRINDIDDTDAGMVSRTSWIKNVNPAKAGARAASPLQKRVQTQLDERRNALTAQVIAVKIEPCSIEK